MQNDSQHIIKDCMLLLENGDCFFGKGYGDFGTTIGEICFNTSMSGYQEIMTDPSYKNQIITFTFPHIGIVGTNNNDHESEAIHSAGCIVNNLSTYSSNHRSEMYFHDWLKKNKKICISGIDTRTLTRKIRSSGVMKALIHHPKKKNFNKSKLLKKIEEFPIIDSSDLASKVSTKKVFIWKNNKKKILDNKKICELNNKNFIAVIDFGIKENILNLLESLDYVVVVFPSNFDTKMIVVQNPMGIFLSNGPGDPKATYKNHKSNIDFLLKKNIPVFGICLGHQILALAFDARTIKMHHGHRGANHPVKNLKNKQVEITVQNHGFVVDKKKLSSNIIVTHSSLFDGTIAGLKIKNKPFFSVQYHPEASPGPHDSQYLFEEFSRNIENYAKKK